MQTASIIQRESRLINDKSKKRKSARPDHSPGHPTVSSVCSFLLPFPVSKVCASRPQEFLVCETILTRLSTTLSDPVASTKAFHFGWDTRDGQVAKRTCCTMVISIPRYCTTTIGIAVTSQVIISMTAPQKGTAGDSFLQFWRWSVCRLWFNRHGCCIDCHCGEHHGEYCETHVDRLSEGAVICLVGKLKYVRRFVLCLGIRFLTVAR